MPQSETTALIATSLHVSRFGTYATAAGGDMDLALRLYLWNVQLAGAFHSSLGLLEVILRNAIDAELRTWNAAQPKADGGTHAPEWLIDPARPLNSMTANARRTAEANAVRARAARPRSHPRKTAPITHDDILAQLTFGVFVRLLPAPDATDKHSRAREVLWSQALVNAFPGSRDDPDGLVVADRAARLHALRNRVAHMEPLLAVNATARHRDAVRLVGAINPALQGWFAGVSTVREVARARPV
ncbi:hypothetical protein [Microbacterium thalassium]|uniref:Abi-like protein n=1 Tax=Microbacterium thalassium TaxID=362649 RepID=A0A7X0FLN4_9MICO|nr:hypothetical protein [Microbacterium thalassium]MBB6389744.1 hypothetical protein [Microbacterium thalassium]GLK24429.1 hypothetical protein GCM10017607_17470 [Microbacterium thalassium]